MTDDKRSSDTVTVRVPPGTADKVRAVTGQPFSTVVRWIIMGLLQRHADEDKMRSVKNESAAEIAQNIKDTDFSRM